MAIDKLSGTLVYVQLETPVPCFVEEKGKEWKCSIVISEDDADEWDEAYPQQKAKQVKTSEFSEIYKIDPPFADQRKQYVVTLRKNTMLANGKPVPDKYRPKVYLKVDDGMEDITQDKLVANGSEGKISVDHYEGKKGPVARLRNVLVTDFIEYVREEREADGGSEFGLPVKQEKNEFEEEEPKVTPKKEPKKSSKVTPKQSDPDDPDEDDPF